MRQFFKFTSILLIVVIASTDSSAAFFNSECKKPKATYESYLNEYKKQLSAEKLASSQFNSQRDRDFVQCLKNPKLFIEARNLKALRKDKIGCEYWKMFYADYPTIQGRSSQAAKKDAMLIVKNYKKCFDPSVYINALKWLEQNGK